MKRFSLLAMLLVLAIPFALLAGCAETTPDVGPAPTTEPVAPGEDPRTQPGIEGMTVEMRDLAFTPRNIEIRAGDTVTWFNADAVPHTVTGDGGLDSGTLQQGDTYEFTFNETGQFTYNCSVHPAMSGLVVVR